MSRVLVVGGTGVLGRAVVPALVASGHEVSALARSAGTRELVEAMRARPVDGDLLHPDGIAPIDADVVVHAATAIPRPDGGTGSWELNDRIRTAGTGALVAAARRGRVGRIVAVGVTWIYGDHGDEWITEATPVAESGDLRPELRSALALERSVRDSGLEWCLLRAGWVYGPGTGRTESMLDAARAGTLRTNGDGDDFVSMVTASDVASAVVLAVTDLPSGTTINVVDDAPMRERELFSVLARHVGGPDPTPGPRVPSWGSQRVDNRRARSYGFRPAHPDVRSGLAVLVPAPAA